MRATSGTHFLTLLGALAACAFAAPGCQYSMSWSVANPLAANGTAPARPAAEVALAAPRPAAAPDRAPAAWATVASTQPAAPAEQPVVWRASPPGPDAAEVVAPVERVSWRQAVPVAVHAAPLPAADDLPKELNKVTMPPYRIEPPDTLVITALRVIPKPPYRIEPLDELLVQAPPKQVLPDEPISGAYPVGPDGQIDLGYSYGKVPVAGQTPEQARSAISKHVADLHSIKPPAVTVALVTPHGAQQLRGERLVRMDGTVSLGSYGEAYVAGLTLPEAKAAVEAQLALKLLNPEVTVDVAGYNSKVYYVIYDGAGLGQQMFKLPIVGGETVLDAISELRGLPVQSSTQRIWVARPVPGQVGCRQVLPVDWEAITEGAATTTNYQLFPGDRVYVRADHWVAFENRVSKVVAPFERLFGFTLLGNATIRSVGGGAGAVGGF